MIFGAWVSATISAVGTSSAEVDIGRDYDYIQVQLPGLDLCTLNLRVAEKTGGTYRDLDPAVLIGPTTGNYHDTWEIGGWQFIKIVASVSQTASRAIRIRGCRE